MTGATLALYEHVNRDLDGLWERWLKLMEIWDQTQQRNPCRFRTGPEADGRGQDTARGRRGRRAAPRVAILQGAA